MGTSNRTGLVEPASATAVVTAALRKVGVVWLGVDRATPVAAWPLWVRAADGGVLYVLHGPGEQPAPGLAGAGRCQVLVRGRDGALALELSADVETVLPDGDEWAGVAPKLAAARLNLPDPAAAVRRWAAECTVSRLTPDPASIRPHPG
jgi:hypothetical protein